ncbi:hypothetical protein GEMRC1_008598 [Eukaryota sp. GEM-RC1]
MVQSYLRFEHEESFGLTASSSHHGVIDKHGRCLYCPTSDYVTSWNTHLNLLDVKFAHEAGVEVTCVNYFSNDLISVVAVGYANGTIKLFNNSDLSLRCRFDGHRSPVLILTFNLDGTLLASGGADTDIVIWDMATERGQCRLKGHSSAISGISFISNSSSYILTSSRDTTIRLWDFSLVYCLSVIVGHRVELWGLDSVYLADEDVVLVAVGTAFKNVFIHKISLNSLVAGGKRRKNDEEEEKEGNHHSELIGEIDRTADNGNGRSQDYLLKEESIRTKSTIVGFSNLNDSIYITTLENSIEIHKLSKQSDSRSNLIINSGHSAPISSISLTSDDMFVASGSNDGVRVWSVLNQSQTFFFGEISKITSVITVPGNRYVIAGSKLGHLYVIDVSSGSLVHTHEDAHPGGITSIVLESDRGGIITGGADKTLKFFNFEVSTSPTRLTLTLSKTLELSDGVTSICSTHDGKLILVGLLDTSIKVFYSDSFKLFLSLYGHKLPVTSIDVSFDDQLVISGSIDKTVKIWGLDFGDCHRSLRAHDGDVSCVKFLPGTHHFLSCGKDSLVKYWDGDSFSFVHSVHAHTDSATSLAVSSNGSFIISAGKDRSLRLIKKSSSPVFPHLEEGDNLEVSAHQEAADVMDRARKDLDAGQPTVVSTLSLKAGDKLVTALEACVKFLGEQREYLQELSRLGVDLMNISNSSEISVPPPAPPLELLHKTPSNYLLHVLDEISSVDLYDAIAYVPFTLIPDFISLLTALIDIPAASMELLTRVVVILVTVNSSAIKISRDTALRLEKLNQKLKLRLKNDFEVTGKSLQALLMIQREVEFESGDLYDVMTGEVRKKSNIE